MGASQRRKGANGERELVRLLGDELGRDVVRNTNKAWVEGTSGGRYGRR